MTSADTFFDYLGAIPEPLWPVRLRAESAVDTMQDRDSEAVRGAAVDLHGCSGRFLKAAFAAETERERDVLSKAAGACAAMALQAQQLSEQREAAEVAAESEGQ